MIVTLVRIKENFKPWMGGDFKKTPVGEVGYLIDGFGRLSGHLMSNQGEVAVECFTLDGQSSGTYYHVPATCIEMVQDRQWYDAFLKWYDKHPFYEIAVEWVGSEDANYGVWLHVGKPKGGWLDYKHRVLGSEDLKDPNKLVEYWETITNRFGGTLLLVDPYVQALCLDWQDGDMKFPKYHRMWAENVLRAQRERATEQHRTDVP